MDYKTLGEIQNKLKVKKDRTNDYGGFAFRSAVDILEAVKPILKDYNACVVLTDDIVNLEDRFYIRATASIVDEQGSISTSAFAREPLKNDRMNESQTTGSASSYARKYALQGLLALDDASDDIDGKDSTDTLSSTARKWLDDVITKAVNAGINTDDILHTIDKKAETYEDLSINEARKYGAALMKLIKKNKETTEKPEKKEIKETEEEKNELPFK